MGKGSRAACSRSFMERTSKFRRCFRLTQRAAVSSDTHRFGACSTVDPDVPFVPLNPIQSPTIRSPPPLEFECVRASECVGASVEKLSSKSLGPQNVAVLEESGKLSGEEDAESHNQRTAAEPRSVSDEMKICQTPRCLTPDSWKVEDKAAELAAHSDPESEDVLPSPSKLIRRKPHLKGSQTLSRVEVWFPKVRNDDAVKRGSRAGRPP